MDVKNLFESFDSVSKDQWKHKIEQDLKGAQYEESVVWQSELGIEVQPFYHAEDLRDKDITNFCLKDHRAVLAQEFIWMDDPKAFNRKLLNGLKYGVSSIVIDLSNSLITQSELITALHEVQTDLLDVSFKNIWDEEEFSSLLEEINFKAKSGCAANSLSSFFIHAGEQRTALIDGTKIGNESASMILELACSLSKGVQVVASNEKNNDVFLQFNFVVAGNYFFEIAKLRAFRFLWKVIANELNLQREDCYVQSQLADYNKSASDNYLNIIRATTETMSAIIGGADAVIINRSADATADENTTRIHNNVFNILQFESGISKAPDPAAGSFYIESLTDKIARSVWAEFLKIQDVGGYDDFSKLADFRDRLNNGKMRSLERLQEIETKRNLYQS